MAMLMSRTSVLQQIVKSILSESRDDIDAAKDEARERIKAEVELSDAAIDYAIDRLVDDEWRAGRSARWSRTTTDSDPRPEPNFTGGISVPSSSLLAGMRAEVAVMKERLMDYEMEPGKRLGQCAKGDILISVDRLNKQASTMRLRASWLRAVADMLPDSTQRVEAVLREADLRRLQERVMRESE